MSLKSSKIYYFISVLTLYFLQPITIKIEKGEVIKKYHHQNYSIFTALRHLLQMQVVFLLIEIII